MHHAEAFRAATQTGIPLGVCGADPVIHPLQDLMARGLLAPSKAKALGLTGGAVDDLPEFGQDVTINDAPPQQRYLLTKRTTQEEIQRRTGTEIKNRGRYYAPGEPVDEQEKPLFLRVAPGYNLPVRLEMPSQLHPTVFHDDQTNCSDN